MKDSDLLLHDALNEAARILDEPLHRSPLKELRGIVNARLQTCAISQERAKNAGRHYVAMCRESDVETLEWVIGQIDAAIADEESTRLSGGCSGETK